MNRTAKVNVMLCFYVIVPLFKKKWKFFLTVMLFNLKRYCNHFITDLEWKFLIYFTVKIIILLCHDSYLKATFEDIVNPQISWENFSTIPVIFYYKLLTYDHDSDTYGLFTELQ